MKLGIDEAGRGCIIGPMIVAGVIINEKQEKTLKVAGVKDSKQLSRQEREKLFNTIIEFSELVIINKAFPCEIDSENLNKVTYKKVNQIIMASIAFSPNIVTVDKVGKEDEVIQLINKIGAKPNVVYKADELFVESSAASIVAKVTRDRIIDSLKEEYGDFGSGYPSDPKTKEWIRQIYSTANPPPKIIRRTWKSLLKLAPNYYISKGI
ncbi:ribonuclease HII [Acidianus sulfidivorans JP7]|uniref:Ribonuclease HII n=1 Tax=Acidianus sulfidivorans JP7 TaxID=619593 RepID=A0A2U9IKT7_9CREN|nr:ribonuclease HII [Acidianus sulfidivorans]AWR96658.1 ribonuclease HII [Acidianus sulfidivorans JP7]